MGDHHRSRFAVVAALIVTLFAFATLGCDPAKVIARPIIGKIVKEMNAASSGWRVHLVAGIPAGTEVSAFRFNGMDQPTYVCEQECVVFFLDLDPYAHFAHPTKIIVYDPGPISWWKRVHDLKATTWWPTVKEVGMPYPRSIFSTVAERQDPANVWVVGGLEGELPPTRQIGGLVATVEGIERTESHGGKGYTTAPINAAIPTPIPGSKGEQQCDNSAPLVWAVLVNGYDDPSDSFDEDVSGMYSVLRGLGVPTDRIYALSPFDLIGKSTFGACSESALKEAFDFVADQMALCAQDTIQSTAGSENGTTNDTPPQFLLLWSSHGGKENLACNLADGGQDVISAGKINYFLSSLQNIWEQSANPVDLDVTVVIEACESGTVGQYLRDHGNDEWRILTSTGGEGESSYRDYDRDVAGFADPNPADSGSETIWGYVEAFGTASADSNKDGKIDFAEAVAYAEAMDVTLNRNPGTPGESGWHEIQVWSPTGDVADAAFVHGAGNASSRATANLAFTGLAAPADTVGLGQSVVAPGGPPVDLELTVANTSSSDEVGALALRVFRPQDETCKGTECTPTYFKDGFFGTTVMVEGLPALASTPVEITFDPGEVVEAGTSVRLVALLDSAQAYADGSPPDLEATEITVTLNEQGTGQTTPEDQGQAQ